MHRKLSAALLNALANLPQRSRVENRANIAPLAGRRFELANDASADAADLYLYDEIGYWGITAAMVADALAPISAATLRVHINSGGGDIWDGVAIYNLLVQNKARVEVSIDAMAASIASVIAMAGDDIAIGKNAMMMIHRASGLTLGDADDMRAMADILELHENNMIVPSYQDRTGISAVDLLAMMKAETWMNADQCVAKGFANRVIDSTGTKALIRPGLYARMPKELINAADWKCGAAADLPIDEADSWDGAAAKERVFEWAGFNGASPDAAKAKTAFLAYDASAPAEKGSYKLPFADVRNGKLTAMEGGLRAAASRLPDTDIPDEVKTSARQVLDDYFARRDKEKGDAAAGRVANIRARTRVLVLSTEV